MDEIKENNTLDISSFDENEVVNLLLKAFSIANKKCKRLGNECSKYKEEIKSIGNSLTKMEQAEKAANEKIAEIQRLSDDSVSEAKAEAVKKVADAEKVANEKIAEIQRLSDDSVSDAKAEAVKKVADAEKAANEKIAEIQRLSDDSVSNAKAEAEEKIVKLKEEVKGMEDTLDRRELILVRILVNKLSSIIKQLAKEQCENDQWKVYLGKISSNITDVLNENDLIEQIIEKLLLPDAALSRLVSLCWWNEQSGLKEQLCAQIGSMDQLSHQTIELLDMLRIVGYTVDVPVGAFASDIDHYDLYDNGNTKITQLFPEFSIEKNMLCEVYKLACNNKQGSCYYN